MPPSFLCHPSLSVIPSVAEGSALFLCSGGGVPQVLVSHLGLLTLLFPCSPSAHRNRSTPLRSHPTLNLPIPPRFFSPRTSTLVLRIHQRCVRRLLPSPGPLSTFNFQLSTSGPEFPIPVLRCHSTRPAAIQPSIPPFPPRFSSPCTSTLVLRIHQRWVRRFLPSPAAFNF